MSTTSDLALLRRKLAASDYSPALYVKEMSNRCVGGHELHLQRKNIQILSDDTHSQLKKNVYENYGQFMTTAKEISFLESEMYQLSHMISEQRTILQTLAQTSVLGEKAPLDTDNATKSSETEQTKEEKQGYRNEFEERRRLLYDLLERVEGCSHVTDVPSRHILHSGDLVEMDIAENTALHRVHGYLMNDGFMVATWLPNRRGPVRFKYSCLYELDSLAVVNVRNFGSLKHAFKLLVFPDSRLFQCANAESKQVWMEAFDNAKKNRQKELETVALKRSDTITQRERKRLGAMRYRNPFVRGESTESSNPFAEENEDNLDLDDDSGNPFNNSSDMTSRDQCNEDEYDEDIEEVPEWLVELPDELEVYIAQREFEQALNLLIKGENFCKDPEKSKSPLVRSLAKKVEQRRKNLLEVLAKELSTDKAVQAGPRSARRAVQLLTKLGKSASATDLFLKHRHAILQNALKSVKLETSTIPYVQRLSTVFFSCLGETSLEFKKCFMNSRPSKTSAFLTWLDEELDVFCAKVGKQIFATSTPLEVIASCLSFIHDKSEKMLTGSLGIDISFLIDARFRRNVERTICEHRDKHVEAVKLRSQEDNWEPINCFNASGKERFLHEMSSAGFPSIHSYVYDDCWIALTRNTTSFSLSYLSFADSLLKLFNPSLRSLINETLVTVFHSHLRHIEQAVRCDKLKNVDPTFLQKNAAYLLDTLLSLIEVKYAERTKSEYPKLGKLHSSYKWLKEGQIQGATV